MHSKPSAKVGVLLTSSKKALECRQRIPVQVLDSRTVAGRRSESGQVLDFRSFGWRFAPLRSM